MAKDTAARVTPAASSAPVPALEQLKAQIRGAGLRSTSPRIAVLRHLLEATAPTSHAELVEALATEGFDRTTVYRNLIDMADAGLLARTDLGDHVWRFELKRARDDGKKHPHFTCSECGTVSCLPDVTLAVKRGTSRVPKSLSTARVEIQLRGVCDECE